MAPRRTKVECIDKRHILAQLGLQSEHQLIFDMDLAEDSVFGYQIIKGAYSENELKSALKNIWFSRM